MMFENIQLEEETKMMEAKNDQQAQNDKVLES